MRLRQNTTTLPTKPRMWRALVCGALFFFLNDTAPTEIYTLSLHDALPISSDLPAPKPVAGGGGGGGRHAAQVAAGIFLTRVLGYVRERVFAHYFGNDSIPADAFRAALRIDRKSTRLNSSH